MKKPPSKAVIRRRNNARIKKLVAPKAPVQVLNELVGPGNVKFRSHDQLLPSLGGHSTFTPHTSCLTQLKMSMFAAKHYELNF